MRVAAVTPPGCELLTMHPGQDLFCNVGGFEYDIRTDEGVGNSFWNGKMNFEACSWRVDEVHKRFLLLASYSEGVEV